MVLDSGIVCFLELVAALALSLVLETLLVFVSVSVAEKNYVPMINAFRSW
jgi:hypothetical protein